MQKDYGEAGLVILAFPSNTFGKETGNDEEILEFVKKYAVSFRMMAKIEVNGPTTPPLFRWLKLALNRGEDLEWNFTKFLIAPHGFASKMYKPEDDPDSMRPLIEAMLATHMYGGKHRTGAAHSQSNMQKLQENTDL